MGRGVGIINANTGALPIGCLDSIDHLHPSILLKVVKNSLPIRLRSLQEGKADEGSTLKGIFT